MLPPRSPLALRVAAASAGPSVTLEHDGAAVHAFEHEPIAMALLAADRVILSRSPKLHRARGPSCLRGHCEGCLVRVDDEPNVMACRARARGGAVIRSQNAFPTAALDVFAVADWFFPRGMDHHHLFVGAGRALNESMQYVARKMSGLGALPEGPRSFEPARTLRADVLVVGAGASGVAASNALCDKGFDVVLVDLGPGPGGARRDDPLDGDAATPSASGVRALHDTAAVACFDDATLLEDPRGALRVEARATVFATGTHDVIGAFEGSDLPGVFSARALCRALCHGVLVGERVALVGDGFWITRAEAALRTIRGVEVERGPLEGFGATGARRVERASWPSRRLRCDAVAVAGTEAASYELAGQAGVALRWSATRGCFEPGAGDEGETNVPGVYVCGTLRTGVRDPATSALDGERVAARVARDLARGGAR